MCSRLPCSTRFPYTTLFRSHGGGIDGGHLAPGGAPGDLGEGHGRGDLAEGVEVLLGEPRVCGEDDLGPGVTHTLEVDAVGLVEEHRDLTAQLLELRLDPGKQPVVDRKSTRLNSSHVAISYAVFCLKKKKRL